MTPLRYRLQQIAGASWLQRVWLKALAFAFAYGFDDLVDTVVAAVKARFPKWAAINLPDALPRLGQERGVRRGYLEGDASYGERLAGWLPDRREIGSPVPLLRQVAGYLSGYSPRLRVVNDAGAWWSLLEDGTIEYQAPNGNWIWDGSTASPTRYWLILYAPTLWTTIGEWGDGSTWGDGGVWAPEEATATQVQAISEIARQWNPPHAYCAGIIVSIVDAAFDPADTVGAWIPAGDWDHWANRYAGAAYWETVM